MSFSTQYALATDPTFIAKVAVAMTKAAVAVASEASTTAHHGARATFAKNVLHDPLGYAPKVALAVVSNAAITSESDDGAIEFTVNSMWDAFSGSNL